MDVVIDTNTWLKIIMMVAHFVPLSLQWPQDVFADKAVTLIMVRQKDIVFKPLWWKERDRSACGTWCSFGFVRGCCVGEWRSGLMSDIKALECDGGVS